MLSVQSQSYQAASTAINVAASVDEQISAVRSYISILPISNLIHHADTWFNLRGEPQWEIQLSPTLKEQLLHAAKSSFDANLTPDMAGFDVDTLSIPDLVLLYRIINSYQIENPEPILLVHLDVIKHKLFNIGKNDPSKETLMMDAIKINGEHDLKSLKKFLLLHLHEVQDVLPADQSSFNPGVLAVRDVMVRVFRYLDPQSFGVARTVCKAWNTISKEPGFLHVHTQRVLEAPFFVGIKLANIVDRFSPKLTLQIADGLVKKALGDPILSKPLLTASAEEIRSLTNPNRNLGLITFCNSLPESITRTLPSLQRTDLTVTEKAKLLRRELKNSEAVKNLKELDLKVKNLSILPPEISLFTSLEILDVSSNQLTELPSLMANKKLKTLNVPYNQLKKLPEIRANIELQSLDVSSNKLTELPNLIGNIKLKTLSANTNKLTKLPDLSFCTELFEIVVSFNQLTELPNLSSNRKLRRIYANNNQLTKLPVMRPSSIEFGLNASVYGNPLTEFPDYETIRKIQFLYVSYSQLSLLPNLYSFEKLTELRIKGNLELPLPDHLQVEGLRFKIIRI